MRALIYTRAFNTGDATDYVFNYADNDIDLTWSKMSSPTFPSSYLGSANRAVLLNTPLSTLGVEGFSLNAAKIYPNLTNGNFTIESHSSLQKVNIYSHTGVFVKLIEVNNSKTLEISIEGLQTGIYLLELKNDNYTSLKILL